jgi:hypothetical protein
MPPIRQSLAGGVRTPPLSALRPWGICFPLGCILALPSLLAAAFGACTSHEGAAPASAPAQVLALPGAWKRIAVQCTSARAYSPISALQAMTNHSSPALFYIILSHGWARSLHFPSYSFYSLLSSYSPWPWRAQPSANYWRGHPPKNLIDSCAIEGVQLVYPEIRIPQEGLPPLPISPNLAHKPKQLPVTLFLPAD